MNKRTLSYRGHRFPTEIISHAVWLYHRCGRITIANCDSGSGSDAQIAIEMASRAVNELG